jgi:RNA polymerase sporulation-specific sigma factor
VAVPTPSTEEHATVPARAIPDGARKSGTGPGPDDEFLVSLAKHGRTDAYDQLVRRYRRFVRVKSSSYFLLGGDADDLMQEGMLGLFKAIRDYRPEREASFRGFAELCITRQIITAVKTATRNKHTPLNQYVSFSQTPAAAGPDSETTLACLTSVLSELESRVLALYLDGHSYEVIGEKLDCDTKTVDNALQRVKRKVGIHLDSRMVKV